MLRECHSSVIESFNQLHSTVSVLFAQLLQLNAHAAQQIYLKVIYERTIKPTMDTIDTIKKTG
jgi:hypothetical protein